MLAGVKRDRLVRKAPVVLVLFDRTIDGVNDLSEATNKAMARLSINAKYYAVAGAVKTPAGSRNHSVDGSTERLSKEIGALREQINDIQKSVLGMYGKASGSMDPAVRLAVEQLDATRRHVLLRFDAEIQLMRQPKSQTQFDSASAMDAQRILAKLSNIESKLDALSG